MKRTNGNDLSLLQPRPTGRANPNGSGLMWLGRSLRTLAELSGNILTTYLSSLTVF